MLIATALINGTHGLSFAHKFALISFVLLDTCFLLIAICGNGSAIVIACADTYAPEPPYYRLREPGSRVLFLPDEAQGSLPWGPTHSTTPYAYQPRAGVPRTYRVPWHHRPLLSAKRARSSWAPPSRMWP